MSEAHSARVTGNPSFLLHGDKALGILPLAQLLAVHLGLVDDDEAVGVDGDGEALEWPRRGALEVDAGHVVPGPVARALELTLARQPVGDAPQVRADRADRHQLVLDRLEVDHPEAFAAGGRALERLVNRV